MKEEATQSQVLGARHCVQSLRRAEVCPTILKAICSHVVNGNKIKGTDGTEGVEESTVGTCGQTDF